MVVGGGGYGCCAPLYPTPPLRPSSPGPCSGEPQLRAAGEVQREGKKQKSPLCVRVWARLPAARSLQSFRAINGFPHSELANEPAWEAAGAEGPQTGAAEGGEQLLLA